MTQIFPHLMFQGQLNAALDLWAQAFGPLDLDAQARTDTGETMQAKVNLFGQTLSLFDSPPVHDFGFTPAISLMVECTTVDEVDRLAGILGEGGQTMMPLDTYDFSPRFAWVRDPFGVSWQVMMRP